MANYSPLRSTTAGTPIKADWGRNITSGIKAVRPMLRDGQMVSTSPYGTKIEYDATTSSVLNLADASPFQVEWLQYSKDNPDDGDWIIYLPYGCVSCYEQTYSKACIPLNEDATDGSGDIVWQWYKMEKPEQADATISQYSGYVAKEWTVYVHIKPWARIKAITKSKDDNFGAAEKIVAVATIGEVSFTDSKWRGMVKLTAEESITLEHNDLDTFPIRYEIGDDKDAEPKIKITNQTVTAGRQTVSIAKDTSIGRDWEEVWLKIIHKDTTVSIEIKSEGEDSNDDETWVLLYKLKDGVATQDNRASIPNLDFYTNAPDSGTD